MASLSIITATFNSGTILPELISSLEAQTDKDFTWIVADGGSSDNTLEMVSAVTSFDVLVDSRSDFVIYDAINRGIKLSLSTYYVVAGSDDTFDSDAVRNYKKAILSGSSFIVARLRLGNKVYGPTGGSLLVHGQRKLISGHAVALAIRRDLHRIYGYYSNKYPIAADQYFVQTAYLSGEGFYQVDFVAGTFSPTGLSGRDLLGALSESFRVSFEVTGHLYSCLALFLLKLFKYRSRILRSLI